MSHRAQALVDYQPTPLGMVALSLNSEGAITRLEFLQEDFILPLAPSHHSSAASNKVFRHLLNYFEGDLSALNGLTLSPQGTDWQHRVWNALRKIAPGDVISYGGLAQTMGMDGTTMARAVGSANRTNPIAIAIPCHRVVGQDGHLQGYAWGLTRKAWLLNHERSTPSGLCEGTLNSAGWEP